MRPEPNLEPNPGPDPELKRVWSIELVLVIVLPATAVIAGLFTLYLAISHPFGAVEHGVDRFGRATAEQTP